MKQYGEGAARIFVVSLLVGLFLALGVARWIDKRGIIEVRAAMPENGGWSPEDLTVEVGQALKLRLVSDDVVHGFAIGQSHTPEIELEPGKPIQTEIVFDRPGKYVYYCTRWCGPNHWRMRGTIEVLGPAEDKLIQEPPLYVTLGLDLDAEHHAENIPAQTPSAKRGADLKVHLPNEYFSQQYYRTTSPELAWEDLSGEQTLVTLNDGQIWDLAADLWSRQTSQSDLLEGRELYAANCAACHGEAGAGDGVMANELSTPPQDDHDLAEEDDQLAGMPGHAITQPTDFTDAEHMLGASPAVLHGKIVRGGMGSGMPYWGPIFTDEQIWNIVSYLWTFQFQNLEDNS